LNVASPANVRNGDMIRVRVCVPLTFNFTETFSLTYGGQLDTFTVLTTQAPPPPPSPPTIEKLSDNAEAATNFSVYAHEVLRAAVSADCESQAASTQIESITAAADLVDATELDAAQQANLTTVQIETASAAATAASDAAAQGAIDVANTAITGIITADVAASAADLVAKNAARAAALVAKALALHAAAGGFLSRYYRRFFWARRSFRLLSLPLPLCHIARGFFCVSCRKRLPWLQRFVGLSCAAVKRA